MPDFVAQGQVIARRIAPALFPQGKTLPLQYKIKDTLLARCESPQEIEQLEAFLCDYCGSTAYIETLAQGGPRFDINGNEKGRVTDYQQFAAKCRLELSPEVCVQKLREHSKTVRKANKARKVAAKQKKEARAQLAKPKEQPAAKQPEKKKPTRPILSLKKKPKSTTNT